MVRITASKISLLAIGSRPLLGSSKINSSGRCAIAARRPALARWPLESEPKELENVPKAPGSLSVALEALQQDHDFLLRGDVFTEDVISTWITLKKEKEIAPMQLRPHPFEFCLYYDA